MDCPIQFPEFTHMVKEFSGDRTDPTVAECWMEEMEKAFVTCQMPEDKKLSIVAFLLKKDTNN